MLKKQKEIDKILDNIQKETNKIDKILEEMGIEEVEDKEVEDAEERGIKNTMRYLKDAYCVMEEDYKGCNKIYHLEEEELNEDDKDLIERIKQM